MENQNRKTTSSDELDISQFFVLIGRGFRKLGTSSLFAIGSLRSTFLQRRIFFISLIILGLVTGAIYSVLLKRDYYKSSMVLSCDYLNTQIVNNTIEKLNLLCQEKEREGLAQKLNIDIATAKNIYRFESRTFISEDDVVELEVLRTQLNNLAEEKKDLVNKVMTRLEIENKNAYEISIMVYDPSIVRSLEKNIVEYFRNNDYIKRRIEINNITLQNRRAKLIRESAKLDSLKAVMFQNFHALRKTSGGSNNVILGDEKFTDPIDVFKQDLEIFADLIFVDKQLYIHPDFEIVDGFTTFRRPESAGLSEILLISFGISLLIGYAVIGIMKFNQILATRYA